MIISGLLATQEVGGNMIFLKGKSFGSSDFYIYNNDSVNESTATSRILTMTGGNINIESTTGNTNCSSIFLYSDTDQRWIVACKGMA